MPRRCLLFVFCLTLALSAQAQYLSGSLADRIESTTQAWGELGFDTCARIPGTQGMKLRIKDQNYAHGLGHHANGEIVVNLDRQFKTFEADIGIQWQGGANIAAVVFQVLVDGREAFNNGIVRELDPPKKVVVSVEGARELRLISKAAGDGINDDCADWADVQLVPNPGAPAPTVMRRLDIAPFAKVLSWDARAMTGTAANRVQEMPKADIFPATELLPAPDGTWQVPLTNGTGSIGLQWAEDRALRRVSIQLKNPVPAPSLQYWTGESEWQGKWQPMEIAPVKIGDNLVWSLGYLRIPHGTQKIRWVFQNAMEPPIVRAMSAFSASTEEKVSVHIESARRAPETAEIEIYNGTLAGKAQGTPNHLSWDITKPLSLTLLAITPQVAKADRAVLRFRFPDIAFGVAIEDLQSNDAVWVPQAGLFVTRDPAPLTLDEYLKKIESRNSVLKKVRAAPDQSFPHAWNVVHRTVEDLEPTMISLAGDNRKFIVRRDGVVGFNEYESATAPEIDPGNWNWLATSQWQLLPRFGSGQNASLSRHLFGGWLPVPVTSVTESNVVYEETTYVAPLDEKRALCGIEFEVKNSDAKTKDVHLSFQLKPGHDTSFALEFRKMSEGWVALHNNRIVAVIDGRKVGPLSLAREGNELQITGTLSPGEKAGCAVYLPAWKLSSDKSAALLPKDSWLPRVAKYWEEQFASAMQIEIPDAPLGNIIRASQVFCAVAARNESNGTQIAPRIASAFYGPLESEANSIIRGMYMTGHAEFTRRSFDYFLGKCSQDGFITTGYTLVGTGELLWNIGECYQRDRDRHWLRANAPEIVRLCQWIIRQRKKTRRLDVHGERAPESGLMPPGVTADWDRFAYRFFNDAQYCAGLEWAGRALADIGDPMAGPIAEEARKYRADILRAYHWTQARTPVNALADGTWVPSDPSFLNCFGHIEDYYQTEDGGRGWCYSIECGSHHLAANQILDPKSPDADWMVNFLEDVQFLRDGWGEYPAEKSRADTFDLGGFAKLQPYYCRIAEIHALRDDVKPFIRSYFNTIPSLVNGENLSFCEHFHNFGAWNKTHETGWFLCQTRLMFVMERGNDLWLAPFVTSHWMENGMSVTIRNAPTAFGKVGYRISSDVAHGKIKAVVTLPPHIKAHKVVLRLRHPDGMPMRSVAVQGRSHTDFDPQNETISFTPHDRTVTVEAHY